MFDQTYSRSLATEDAVLEWFCSAQYCQIPSNQITSLAKSPIRKIQSDHPWFPCQLQHQTHGGRKGLFFGGSFFWDFHFWDLHVSVLGHHHPGVPILWDFISEISMGPFQASVLLGLDFSGTCLGFPSFLELSSC